MLDLAAKHESKLQELFADITFDDKYKFLYANSYRDKYKSSESTWNLHEFVSVHNDQVIGYLRYSIDRDSNIACGLQIVNFYEKNVVFSKDLWIFLNDIFSKFQFRKLKFSVIVGNPIEKMYDKYIAKFGGRVVGIEKDECKLIDGNYYDLKIYEILKEEYLRNK